MSRRNTSKGPLYSPNPRMYLKSEVTSRLQILNDFYASNYKPPHPNPILTDLHKLMLKRSNKLDKLFYQKQN